VYDTTSCTSVGNQPTGGPWADCLAASECSGDIDGCVTTTPSGAPGPDNGYCFVRCASPVDCPATPGGDAPVTCAVDLGASTIDKICALDCAGGQTCPTGMTCTQIGDAKGATHNVCV